MKQQNQAQYRFLLIVNSKFTVQSLKNIDIYSTSIHTIINFALKLSYINFTILTTQKTHNMSNNVEVNKVTLLIKAEGRHSHRSQAIEEWSSEKISSFKRQLLKGKWSQNASTNKFAPRDKRECVAGRIIHVGEGVMNWKGCRKCAVLSVAL